jgi:hypothetical protein
VHRERSQQLVFFPQDTQLSDVLRLEMFRNLTL